MEVVNRRVKKRYIIVLWSFGRAYEIILRLMASGGSPGL